MFIVLLIQVFARTVSEAVDRSTSER